MMTYVLVTVAVAINFSTFDIQFPQNRRFRIDTNGLIAQNVYNRQ